MQEDDLPPDPDLDSALQLRGNRAVLDQRAVVGLKLNEAGHRPGATPF
jgi:hypothetical protein